MKKRLILIFSVFSILLSACYYPIHDENGKAFKDAKEAEEYMERIKDKN